MEYKDVVQRCIELQEVKIMSAGVGDTSLVFIQTYDQAQKLVTQYEQSRDPQLLEKMRGLRPIFTEALENHSKATAGVDDPAGILNTMLAMGYRIQGGLSLYLEDYAEACESYEKAKDLALRNQNYKEAAMAANNLGTVARAEGDYARALEAFREALEYVSHAHDAEDFIPRQIQQNIAEMERMLQG